jgi:hypothetical protein
MRYTFRVWQRKLVMDIRKRRGRPRKHANSLERARAFRTTRGLRRVTVDVPEPLAPALRCFANWLRRRDQSPTFDAMKNQQSLANSRWLVLPWKKSSRLVHLIPLADIDYRRGVFYWTVRNDRWDEQPYDWDEQPVYASGETNNILDAIFIAEFVMVFKSKDQLQYILKDR